MEDQCPNKDLYGHDLVGDVIGIFLLKSNAKC